MASNSSKGAAQAAPTLDELADQIRATMEAADRTALSNALEVGDLLIKAKAQVPRGQWEGWVKDALGMPRNTSALYVRVASNVQRVVHCKTLREADVLLRKPSKPKQPAEPKPKKQPREAGKRLRSLRLLEESKLLTVRTRIMQMVGILEGIDLTEFDLSGCDPDTIADIYFELSILAKWADGSLDAVAAEMDDLRKQATIRKLREGLNGRTPAEVATAERLAAKLERKRHALRQ